MKELFIEGVKYVMLEEDEITTKLEGVLPASNKMSNGEIEKEVIESVLHWNASSYTGYSHHYQINICFDQERNKVFALVAHKDNFLLAYDHSHTWKRNTGRIGLSYVAMYDTNKYPVTDSMMKLGGQVLAVVCKKFNLHPQRDILDHKHFADIDGYPGERWDTQLKLSNGETVSSRTVRYTTEYINRNKYPISPKEKHIETVKKIKTPTVFIDVMKEDWYSTCVLALHDWNILAGYVTQNGLEFKPALYLTRELAFVLIHSTFSFISNKLGIAVTNTGLSSNNEILNSKYKNELSQLEHLGLIHGDSNGNLNLDHTLTRAELCVLLAGVFDKINNIIPVKISIPALPDESFLDLPKDHWAYSVIEKNIRMSTLIGYKEVTGHYFKPDNRVTRAEFSASLYKILTFFKKNNVIKL